MGTGSHPVPSTFSLNKKTCRPSEACFWDFRREIPFAYGVLCDSFRKADDQASASGSKKSPFFGRDFFGGKVGQRHMAGFETGEVFGGFKFWVSYICATFLKPSRSLDFWSPCHNPCFMSLVLLSCPFQLGSVVLHSLQQLP